ncbi:MAG: phosphoribosylformimino-5-aminoimidazole carboxamide ribotide isomerase [Verrucomicrobiales bacterium]|jgi:phosphoribosylformimino-5-aminoimidazole carboxamide ribotide isomerase|nr:phosphoribosylformimino-5-aminoimidazole carboxamide ribotide isomerase [Verrucomicrobiales bacterium]
MTKFRPCIDLHDGLVKQVIGGTFAEDRDKAPIENFVSERKSRHFAEMYRNDNLVGGHVIMLGSGNEESASDAIKEYPQGLQLGGGITPKNAAGWLDRGATHVIVTSYIFEGSFFSDERLSKMVKSVGKDRLVIDLSCRVCSEGGWKVAKDRWQTITNLSINHETLDKLSDSCSEFLIHAADVEGKCEGIDVELVKLLGSWGKIPLTYAGGVRSIEDLHKIDELSSGCLDVTVGSALDIFGGTGISYSECVEWNDR